MSWNDIFLSRCAKHQFKLIPTDQRIKHKESAFAQFCHFSRDNKNNDQLYDCHFADLPIFNHDHNYTSATFILQSERQNINKNQETSRQKQWSLIASQYCQKSIDKNNYCSVCRVFYEDYFKHIQKNKHKFQTKISSFNKDIQDLTKLIRKRTFKQSSQGQKDIQIFDGTLCSENDQDSVEIIEIAKKKIKRNEKSEVIIQQKIVPLPFRQVQLEVDCAKQFVRIFRGQQKPTLSNKHNQQDLHMNKYPPISTFHSKKQDHKINTFKNHTKKEIQRDQITKYIIIDD